MRLRCGGGCCTGFMGQPERLRVFYTCNGSQSLPKKKTIHVPNSRAAPMDFAFTIPAISLQDLDEADISDSAFSQLTV